MKKVISTIIAATLLLSAVPVLADNVENNGGFTYTKEGELLGYSGEETEIVIEPEIDGTPIKKIADGAFADSAIERVDILGDVLEIGKDAFKGCEDLWYASIQPEGVKIGEGAFSDCPNLMIVDLYSLDLEIGKDAFSGTGEIYVYYPCTYNESDIEEKVRTAKGDDNFYMIAEHEEVLNLVDDYGEATGEIYCPLCGYTGFAEYEDEDMYSEMPFEDVPEDSWYYNYVSIAYYFGILNGKSETGFDPDSNMTVAEAAKIAACIHNAEMGYVVEFVPYGDKWYTAYVDYCYENGIIEDNVTFDWDKSATRAEMAYIFARSNIGEYEINPDVPLTDIPDVSDATPFANEILALYRRGIAAGSDAFMTFHPDDNVKRSEAAAFIARILMPSERIELPKG